MTETERQPSNYQFDNDDLQMIKTILDQLPILDEKYQKPLEEKLAQIILAITHKAERYGMERMHQALEAWYNERVLDPKEIDVEDAARTAVLETVRLREGKSEESLNPLEYRELMEIADQAIIGPLPEIPHIIVTLNQLADQNAPQ